MTLGRGTAYTVGEYLEMEETALEKSEYYRGEIFAMAGGFPRHALICQNLHWSLQNHLLSGSCQPYGSDLRIASGVDELYAYPDASIICGPLELVGASSSTAANPTVLIEVLSDSTEAYDRGAKFSLYRGIATLQQYVLVSQTSPVVEVFTRQDDGAWRIDFTDGLEAKVSLASVGIELPLAEIYRKVDFSAPSASSNPDPGKRP